MTSSPQLRDKAEANLRVSEAKYRALFNSINQGFALIEMLCDETGAAHDYIYLEVNQAFEQQANFYQVTGKRIRELMPDVEATWIELCAEVARTGQPQQLTLYAEAVQRWFEVDVFRFGDEASQQVGLIFQNITERKQAEAARCASESRLRLATEAAAMFLWELNWADQTLHFSASTPQVFGYEALPAEFFSFASALSFVHPDDREHAAAVALEASKGTGSFALEFRIQAATGYIWLEIHFTPSRSAPDAPPRLLGIGQNITQRKHIADALRRSHDELLVQVNERRGAEAQVQELLRRVVSAQEQERQRISRELHDQMGQRLAALLLELRAVQTHAECPPHIAQQLEQLKGSIATIDRDVDRLAFELHPPVLNHLGVAEALRRYAADWTAMSRIPADFQAIGLTPESLSVEAETTLYRVAQEALTNILKHAQATRVGLILERWRNEVRLIIEDNGVGFDLEASAQRPRAQYQTGLRGMRERLALVRGSLTIETEPGQGTTLYARVPVVPQAETNHEPITDFSRG